MPVPATQSTSAWMLRLVPAGTFLVGLLIGGLVTWVGSDSGELPAEDVPTPAASTSASPSPDSEPTEPASEACVEAAASIDDAVRLLRDGAAATRDFQPNKLVEVLNELETLDGELRGLAARCSQVAP